jgi:hypothetical protein
MASLVHAHSTYIHLKPTKCSFSCSCPTRHCMKTCAKHTYVHSHIHTIHVPLCKYLCVCIYIYKHITAYMALFQLRWQRCVDIGVASHVHKYTHTIIHFLYVCTDSCIPPTYAAYAHLVCHVSQEQWHCIYVREFLYTNARACKTMAYLERHLSDKHRREYYVDSINCVSRIIWERQALRIRWVAAYLPAEHACKHFSMCTCSHTATGKTRADMHIYIDLLAELRSLDCTYMRAFQHIEISRGLIMLCIHTCPLIIVTWRLRPRAHVSLSTCTHLSVIFA